MSANPTVSVLLPTYNYGRFLGEAIESVLSQTFTDFELVITDNSSTDNTEEVVGSYLSDSRIRYVRNEQNMGMVPNFNRSLGLAKGKYVKFLMGDDKLHPECLAKMVEVLDNNPQVVLVTSVSESFGNHHEIRQSVYPDLQQGATIIKAVLKDGKGNFIGEPTTVMFRASNLSVGSFNSDFHCLTDLDFWLRQLQLGDIYFLPETLSYFRVHDAQVSFVNNYKNWFDEYRFFKNAKTNNAYGTELTDLNIDKVIKKTALKSAGALYPLITGLLDSSKRKLFFEALQIARKEHVVGSSLVVRLKERNKKHKQVKTI